MLIRDIEALIKLNAGFYLAEAGVNDFMIKYCKVINLTASLKDNNLYKLERLFSSDCF